MSKAQGYNKYEYIVDIGALCFAQSIDTLTFNAEDVSSYKELYLEMWKKQKILNDSFEDDEWLLFTEASGYTTSILFDIDMYHTMKTMLKCFTLLGLVEGHNEKYIQFRIKHVKECIFICHGFEGAPDEVVNNFESWLLTKTKFVLSKLGPVIEQFFEFSNLAIKQELFDIANQFRIVSRSVRNLPNFKDTLVFDSIVNEFQKSWNTEEKLIFYPIILWWKITMIIPMRVIEFCSLESDCISISHSGKILLKIPRKKLQARGTSKLEIVDTLEVNQEIYDLILEYKETIKVYTPTPYLLSYDAYCESPRVKQSYSARTLKRNKETFTPGQLKALIVHFYDEIVEKKYGYSGLERVNPMDTRHYAFCNMMLQGFNMLTIARVGGHRSLDAQIHYFSHLEHLSQSSIQYLADQHKFHSLDTMSSTLGDREKILRAKGMLNQYSKEELDNLPSLEFGYCTYDPQMCPVGDCRYCPYLYIPQDQFTDSLISWLSDESDRINSRIKEQLHLMKSLSCNMTYNLSTFEADPLAQAELSYLARNSKKLREQKSQIDAKLNLIFEERKKHDKK